MRDQGLYMGQQSDERSGNIYGTTVRLEIREYIWDNSQMRDQGLYC